MFKSDIRGGPKTKQTRSRIGSEKGIETSAEVFGRMQTLKEGIAGTRTEVIDRLRLNLKDSPKVRKSTRQTLADMIIRGDEDILDRVVKELKENKDVGIRKGCATVLAKVLDRSSNVHKKVMDGLQEGLKDKRKEVREICKDELNKHKF